MHDPLERVTNLLTLLLERRTALTLEEIAFELAGFYPANPVARRGAFERDKSLLREIGVPIETEVLGGLQAGQTAYRLDRNRYELSGLRLDDDERQALQVAVAAARSEVGQEGVWKLGGEPGPSSPVLANVPQLAQLPSLRAASSAHCTVTFTYRGVDRAVDPYGLLLRTGFWYVVGLDHGHGEVRTFRVDRIEGDVTVGEQGFERPVGFDPRAAFPADPKALGGDEAAEATVLVAPARAAGVRRELGDDAVVRVLDDATVEFKVPCANIDAFRSWLIGLGEHAEVVAPAEVRHSFVAWLRGLAGGRAS